MVTINPEYVRELKTIVRKSPFPRHMAIVLDHIEIDRADIVINLADCHLQPFGIVHGGVFAALIDRAFL